MATKTCHTCKETKETSCFSTRTYPNGNTVFRGNCRPCEFAYPSRQKALQARKRIPSEVPEGSKICAKCKEIKLQVEFRERTYKNGSKTLRSYCRPCDHIYHNDIARKQKAKIKAVALENETIEAAKLSEPVIQTVISKSLGMTEQIAEKQESSTPEEDKRKLARHVYYEKNKEKILEHGRQYRAENKDKLKSRRKVYLQENSEIIRESRRSYFRQYYLDHKDKLHEYQYSYRKSNPVARIRESMRNALLRSIVKMKHTEEYIGSPILNVKLWLESNFKSDMNWSNYGTLWEIDHTLPISRFNMKNEADITICFDWKNLFPMYESENKIKHNKILPQLVNARKEALQKYCIAHDMTKEHDAYIRIYDEYLQKMMQI
jgi:hypothetical protein